MRAIIIDDEKKAQEVLAFNLETYAKNISVVASFSNIQDAAEAIPDLDFDILFLDINMPHGNGFELLGRNLLDNELVIFVTAHEDYAIDAFKVDAFDYLLKPIDSVELIRVIQKAKKHLSTNNGESTIIFKSGYEKVILDISDILHISSEGNYTTIYAKDNKSYMISKNLKKVEELYFCQYPFIRVHQSHIVNCLNIVKFSSTTVTLKNNLTVSVSKQGLKMLKDQIL